MGDNKEKINQDSFLFNFVLAAIAIVANVVTQQKGENIVLSNGNNNEIQIPNEAGFGSNIQI